MGNTLTLHDKLKANAEEDRKRNWTTSAWHKLSCYELHLQHTRPFRLGIINFNCQVHKEQSRNGLFLLDENATQNI
jgi:hypothetical protein